MTYKPEVTAAIAHYAAMTKAERDDAIKRMSGLVEHLQRQIAAAKRARWEMRGGRNGGE